MTKEQFDKKYVGRKLVVSCKTEKLANEFLKLADKFGYTWVGDHTYINDNEWGNFRENTCYNLYSGRLDSKLYYIDGDYDVLEFKGENMKMKASENLILKAFKDEFGLEEGDKFNILNAQYNPYIIRNDAIYDGDGDGATESALLIRDINSVLIGESEIEKIKDTVTVVLADTGEEVEISKESAETLFNR